jgi:chorismate mutase/prephenate dehydratase
LSAIVKAMSETETDWPGGLDDLRRQLDALDDQIVELLAQRADVSRNVARVKQRDGGSVYAPAREAEIFDRLTRRTEGRLAPENLKAIYREIIAGSRDLQRPLRIAYLGPRATFGHQASLLRFGSTASYVPMPSHTDVVSEVERGNADYGVIAIENSTTGPVLESQDRLVETRLQVCDEVTIPVSLYLLARCPLDEIKAVYAHIQAIEQSRLWVAQHLPGRNVVPLPSNGYAAERASLEEGAASISPKLAADEYGLNILAEGIQDNANNYTRFWVVGQKMSERPTGRDKTALVFSIHDRIGTLRDVAQVFAERDLSLSAIHSRPAKGVRPGARSTTWDYVFFFELRGHAAEQRVQDAIKALDPYTVFVKVLGSWPVTS